ncbi:DUF3050 domain-containing protein [Paraburkholderia sp. UYCP14C]|uniref:DUF3050 domain-containing protein n=1 Tax=Paraburkholderia sp. UYCP14C TaxID=2511130 RepID=UPI001021DF78|nr:DUF3050 domain-containing protein [Paraburkholderia sp. UYCP14C]
MYSFGQVETVRNGVGNRLSPGVRRIMTEIGPVRDRLMNHKIYSSIRNVQDLHVFMGYHVFAVWDFMSLLKILQIKLSCTSVPWTPTPDPYLRRLVNEIVLAEETDEDGRGGYRSHFELYREAMASCGADSEPVDGFLLRLRDGCQLKDALVHEGIPAAAARFCMSTFDVVDCAPLSALASTFTFSREDVVPLMFKQTADRLRLGTFLEYRRFIFYPERHIAVDTDSHGPMAYEMVQRICGNDDNAWAGASRAARIALENRCNLWDAAYNAISHKQTDGADFFANSTASIKSR